MKHKNIFIILFTMIFLLPMTVFAEETCSYIASGWYLNGAYTENKGNQQYSAEMVILTIKDNGNVSLSVPSTNSLQYGLDWLGENLLNWGKDKDGFSSISGTCPDYIYIYDKSTMGNSYDWYGSNNSDDYKKFDKGYTHIFVNQNKSKNSYVCSYPDFTLYANISEKTLKANGKSGGINIETHEPIEVFYTLSDEFVDWYFSVNTENKCLNMKMYICDDGLHDHNYTKRVYTDEYLASMGEDKSLKNCKVENSKKNDNDVVDAGCYSYDKRLADIENNYQNYALSNCDGLCKQQNRTAIKSKINDIKTFCSVLTSNLNYDNACVQSCLTLNETITEKNRKYNVNLTFSSSESECGLSDNLIGFIVNILKWVKYLIPAIIIILSIIDFIKAIGSDKDEEMKKAQQKLVKRLIIAVLIFIVPLILEFALDKMGFDSKGCGIINF